jgi:hypothetical protein
MKNRKNEHLGVVQAAPTLLGQQLCIRIWHYLFIFTVCLDLDFWCAFSRRSLKMGKGGSKTITLTVRLDATAYVMYEMLLDKEGIPASQIRLLYQGRCVSAVCACVMQKARPERKEKLMTLVLFCVNE